MRTAPLGLGLGSTDLSGADLSGATLDNATFDGTNLTGATLIGTSLEEAFFGGADLSGADLTDATLYLANLTGSTFSTDTILVDGQTVLQHGFDAASLQAYLEASPVAALVASDLIIVPEPATLLLSLAGLALLPHRSRR